MEPIVTSGLIIAAASVVGNVISQIANKFTNDKNYNFQQEQFRYQQYLNNNQFQIQSADARKAGINPLAMNGGTLSSGNYSNQSMPYSNPFEGTSSLISSVISNTIQKKMNDNNNETSRSNTKDSNETQKEIAEDNNETQKEIAEINARSQETQTQMKINADSSNLTRQLIQDWDKHRQNMNELIRSNKENEAIKQSQVQVERIRNQNYIWTAMAADSREQEKLANARKLLDEQIKNYESLIKARKFDNAAKVSDMINNTLRTVFGYIVPTVTGNGETPQRVIGFGNN